MSTTVHLLYRDACNYKTGSTVVFREDPTPELVARLLAALDDGTLVPEQVGLQHPALLNDIFLGRWPDEEDDHGYVELQEDDIILGGMIATDGRSFTEFVVECEAAALAGWDPMISIAAAGGWRDPELCARLRNG